MNQEMEYNNSNNNNDDKREKRKRNDRVNRHRRREKLERGRQLLSKSLSMKVRQGFCSLQRHEKHCVHVCLFQNVLLNQTNSPRVVRFVAMGRESRFLVKE